MRAVVLVLLLVFLSNGYPRSKQVRAQFQRENPCPVTGKRSGACPGWVGDHICPLACGCPDTPSNMQWQTREEGKLKDRWELRAYCMKTGKEKGDD